MSAIRYTNQRAIRSLPMSEALQRALIPALPAGITAEVFSGGQAAKGSGGPRTGSVRHDHGNAADIRFYDGDRQLDWANPDDLPLFQEIVRRGKANGLTGFGAGPGYMGAGTMHVGFGAPGVWGAGGKSANAPNWLREAYGEAPAGDGAVSGSGGQEMAYGGAGSDTLGTSYGGLGGLGGMQQPPPPEGAEGFLLSPAMGNVFGAISRIATGADPGEAFAAERDVATKRQLLDRQYADTANARRARKMALMSRGFTAEEAEAYSLDDTAATLAIDQKKELLATARNNSTADSLEAKHPDIAAAIRSGTITGLDGAKEAWRRDREVAEAPAITSIFDENGNEQKGYMDPRTREWVNVGGAKSGKSGEGGMYGAPPSGFMYDPADPSRLQPIPGGPGEQISGENAGRIGIAQAFLDRLPSIRARVNDGGATGWIDATLGKAGLGEQGALAADIASGVDALQRMLSGAGTPEAESAQYAKRYAPTANDTVATLNSKLNRLEAELNSQMSVVLRGRGGKSGAAASSPAAPSAPAVTSGSSSGLGWSVK